jgi:hypothetical protein
MSNKNNEFYYPLKEVAARLRADLDSKHPSVSAEIVWAYQSELVLEHLSKRIGAGEKLETVQVLVPDFVLQLRRVFFQFSQLHGFDTTNTGVLVDVGDDNKVKQVTDPFLLSPKIQSALTLQKAGAFPLIINTPISSSGDKEKTTQRFELFIAQEGITSVQRIRNRFGTLGYTTWYDVDTLTWDSEGRSDHQTDQNGHEDADKAIMYFADIKQNPASVFPGTFEHAKQNEE